MPRCWINPGVARIWSNHPSLSFCRILWPCSKHSRFLWRRGCSAIECSSSRCTVWVYIWTKACICRSGILIRIGYGCRFVTPKAVVIVLSHCRRTPCRCYAISGKSTAILHCFSPIEWWTQKSALGHHTMGSRGYSDLLAPCYPGLWFKKELHRTACATVMPPI